LWSQYARLVLLAVLVWVCRCYFGADGARDLLALVLMSMCVHVRCSLFVVECVRFLRPNDPQIQAARHIVEGNSPYELKTYRYTPVLAAMLTPNVWWFKAFGKLLFVGGDMWVGSSIYYMVHASTSATCSGGDGGGNRGGVDSSTGGGLNGSGDLGNAAGIATKAATAAACLWLFNPITATVSTRGNAEPLLAAIVVAAVRADIFFPTATCDSYFPDNCVPTTASRQLRPGNCVN
jgi:hypothetical protein